MMTKQNYIVVAAAALLMLATRSDHFGSAISLPDASLAVFYLLGMFAGGVLSFVLLLTEAALIDYVAITQWQVSDYCISPAYVFLIPTYALMFLAGRWTAIYNQPVLLARVKQFSALVLATAGAFLISNASFYLLSGKFADLSWWHYSERVARYFPPYLGSTVLYSVLVLAVLAVVHMKQAQQHQVRNVG